MDNYLRIYFLEFYHYAWYKNGEFFNDCPVDKSDGLIDYMEGYRDCLIENNIFHTWKEIILKGDRKSHGFIGFEPPRFWKD